MINRILDSEQGNIRINFPPGVYNLFSNLHLRSGVVLRGAGIRRTVFVLNTPKSALNFFGRENDPVVISDGYLLGSSSLKVEDSSSFVKGDLVRIYFEDGRKFYEDSTGSRLGPSAPFDEVRIVRSINGKTIQLESSLNYIYSSKTLPKIQKIYLYSWGNFKL